MPSFLPRTRSFGGCCACRVREGEGEGGKEERIKDETHRLTSLDKAKRYTESLHLREGIEGERRRRPCVSSLSLFLWLFCESNTHTHTHTQIYSFILSVEYFLIFYQ